MTLVTGANRLLQKNKSQGKPTAGSDGAPKYQKPEKKVESETKDLRVSDARSDSTPAPATDATAENQAKEAPVSSAPEDAGSNDSHRPFHWAEVPVSKIRSWRYKDRKANELADDESYQDLLTRLEMVGQLQDIGLRTLETPEGEIEYEEIFGFKRLTAKRELGHKTVTAKVYGVLSDVQAAILQATENQGDSTPSIMSRADNYYGYIRDGVFKNGASLAKMLGVGEKTANNLIRLSRQMPDELRGALELHRLPFPALNALVSLTNPTGGDAKNQEAINLVVKHADEINASPKSCVSVVNKIRSVLNPVNNKSEPRVLEIDGEPAMTLKRDRKGAVTISVPGTFGKNLDDGEIEKIFRELLKN